MLFLEEKNQKEEPNKDILVEDTTIKKPVKEKVKEVNTTKKVVANKKSIIFPKTRKLAINRRGRRHGQQSEFEEKIIDIARVTTVVKGGRRFSFSVFVVVGNKKGKVGFGHGKANEVIDAIKKAINNAKVKMIDVIIIDNRTIPHDQIGKFLASKVLIKPAPKGKGIIASGSIRSVVELAGYKDIYTKSIGSRSKANSVKAVIKALEQLRTIEQIAKLRDVKISNIRGY